MISDWQTQQVFFSALLPVRHPTLWRELAEILCRHGIPFKMLPGTRDIWVRDFLPLQLRDGAFVKFRYQPNYLRGFPQFTTGDDILVHVPLDNCLVSELVLDGGNVVDADWTAILTDKVFQENPTVPPAELSWRLQDQLRVERLVIIPTDPDDEIGHADGVVRFLNPNTVVVNDYSTVNPDYRQQLHRVLRRHGLRVEQLPHFFENWEHGGISSAVGNYVNFLRVQDLVVVPAYGRSEDREVVRRLESFLPGTTVTTLACDKLAKEGGVLNCVSWTVRLAHFPEKWTRPCTSGTNDC